MLLIDERRRSPPFPRCFQRTSGEKALDLIGQVLRRGRDVRRGQAPADRGLRALRHGRRAAHRSLWLRRGDPSRQRRRQDEMTRDATYTICGPECSHDRDAGSIATMAKEAAPSHEIRSAHRRGKEGPGRNDNCRPSVRRDFAPRPGRGRRGGDHHADPGRAEPRRSGRSPRSIAWTSIASRSSMRRTATQRPPEPSSSSTSGEGRASHEG